MVTEKIESKENNIALINNKNPFVAIYTISAKQDYINLDKSIRLERIKQREEQRFGNRIKKGGDLYEQHLSFLEWVANYEDNPETERSRRQHLLWLDDVKQTVLRIADELTIEELLKLVKPFIRS